MAAARVNSPVCWFPAMGYGYCWRFRGKGKGYKRVGLGFRLRHGSHIPQTHGRVNPSPEPEGLERMLRFTCQASVPRDAFPPTPPGPEGSNGNGLLRVQWVAGAWLTPQFASPSAHGCGV